jgi:large subunit ribosomal protein L17
MRHRVHGRKLGRTSAHRKALFRNQLSSLFVHERIVTTIAKAKELRPLAERMVTMARTNSLPARRRALSMVPDREIVRRLFEDIAPRFVDRPGGYTRILRLGRRHGDGAELAILEFVDFTLKSKEEATGKGKSAKPSLMDRARSVLGGKKGEEKAAAPVTPEEGTEPGPEPEPEPAEEEKGSTTAKTD